MRRSRIVAAVILIFIDLAGALAQAPQAHPHNVVLFVADGLRFRMVDESTAPTMAAIAREGVTLRNSHALFPTFTTANASAMATGHMLGDTGDFSNTIYAGFQVPGAGNSLTPFLENDAVLGDIDAHFAGNYLNEATILKLARDKGYSTAAIGKIGPALIFDPTERSGNQTILIDDATGRPRGIPLSSEVTDRLKAADLPLVAPTRGANGKAGDVHTPGTLCANVLQQDYFAAATTRVVLPMFKDRNKPARSRHQWADIARRDWQCGRQSGAYPLDARRARAPRHHRYHRDRRSRLFNDLQAKPDELDGQDLLLRYIGGAPAPRLCRSRPRARARAAVDRPGRRLQACC
jgi:hypothetical protein